MKKVVALVLAFAVMAQTFASAIVTAKPEPLRASDVMIPIANGKTITLQDLADMKAADYAKLTGKKMRFFDRIGFKIAQKKLRNSINVDGTINSKKLEKNFRKAADGSTGFHLGGFALGFLLGLIGVLIAYLLNDEYKSNRVKWAWLGVAAALVFWLLLTVAIIA
ncbi:MAG TPA: hypothetical protein VD996_09405 [Chitinophagaceae bacterium]|nr:hypothetical protein [Chitinophagaceae bacterium]